MEGVFILRMHLNLVMGMLSLFLARESDIMNVLYPAATVLLDLTANENCIELVADGLVRNQMLDFLCSMLRELLEKDIKNGFQMKLRDLFLGILLNLSCNVEDEGINMSLVRRGSIGMLKRILFDERHDWPTNGAALALLQYSHMSLSNLELFEMIHKESKFLLS